MGSRRLALTVTIALCIWGWGLAWAGSALAASAPTIELEAVSDVEYAGATLSATIKPNEAATTYRFEYGSSVSYGTSLPSSEAQVGSGTEAVTVKQLALGLTPGSTYHYRVVAVSAEGTTFGPDKVFRTFPEPVAETETCSNAGIRAKQFASYLPDCRAYEMVSPLDKNGGNISAVESMTQSSITGDAVKYVSPAAFGDTVGMQASGNEYVAQRGPEGWISHSITPHQPAEPYPFVTPEYTLISEDLSKGVYYAISPLAGTDPNVAGVHNLYLRKDLLSAPPGSYELLSDSIEPLPAREQLGFKHSIAVAAASKDLTHIVFESLDDLTPEAKGLPAGAKTYEWHNGTVHLVGILPDGQPAENSVAGQGSTFAV